MHTSLRHAQFLAPLLLLLTPGCNTAPAGSEQAAKGFFATEMQKWMSSSVDVAQPFRYDALATLPPIDYEIRSILPDTPSFFAHSEGKPLPDDYKKWPAYQFNVVVHFVSRANTPLQKVKRYNLTWNAQEKSWWIIDSL